MGESEPVELDFTLVSQGSGQSLAADQPIDSPSYRIVRDQDTWNALWSRRPDPVPQESIDFDNEIVLCVYRGQKPTGGYGISVTSVELRDGIVTVALDMSDPPPGSMLTQALTSPYVMIRITLPEGTPVDADSGAIRFVRAPAEEATGTPPTLTLNRLD